MASLGHIAVGMAAARVYDERVRQRPEPSGSSMAFWLLLSMLSDADVIGLTFGVAKSLFTS